MICTGAGAGGPAASGSARRSVQLAMKLQVPSTATADVWAAEPVELARPSIASANQSAQLAGVRAPHGRRAVQAALADARRAAMAVHQFTRCALRPRRGGRVKTDGLYWWRR